MFVNKLNGERKRQHAAQKKTPRVPPTRCFSLAMSTLRVAVLGSFSRIPGAVRRRQPRAFTWERPVPTGAV